MIDEYVALLAEDFASPEETFAERTKRIAERAATAMELQSLSVEVDTLRAGEDKARTRLSSRFAAAFGASMTEEPPLSQLDGIQRAYHPEDVRQTFNSPFWPWVLVTTSVGQEGLDFHRYCRSIVHWNVPSSPVELEQREGRIQRYKSHAVRQSLARAHRIEALASEDPWAELIRLGRERAPSDDEGFRPEWVPERDGEVQMQRYVPVLPFSRDHQRWLAVKRARVFYRLVLGQPNPDELVEVLKENIDETTAWELVDELRLDLRPRPEVHR
jgi:hypothetical protein